MSRNAVYVRVLLALLAVIILLAFFNRSTHRSQADAWLPSSYNPTGAGTKALYDTLQDLHWPVARWREPMSRLHDAGAGNVLVVTRSAENWRVAFTSQEDDLLDGWVRQGNTLLVFGALSQWADTRDLLRHFGFTVAEPTSGNMRDLFQPWSGTTPPPMSAQAPAGSAPYETLTFPRAEPLPPGFPTGGHVLYFSEGQPVIVDLPVGRGRVIFGSSAEVLANAHLGQGDNLPIMLGLLAPEGRVPAHLFFEEAHHGFTAIFAAARLLQHPGIRFAALLALLGGLTFIGSSLVRFGPIVPQRPATGRSSLEFIDSIAELYHRADSRNEVVRHLFAETHEAVLRRLNLPPGVSHELIAARMDRAFPRLPSWKKLARRFTSREYVEGLPPTGWFRVTRELIQIKAAMS